MPVNIRHFCAMIGPRQGLAQEIGPSDQIT
jgi:hypothetical protein